MNYGLNTITLLILMIVIVASIMGVLALVTANSDYKMALRQADYVTGTRECANEAYTWLNSLSEDIESGKLDGEALSRSFTDGDGHHLTVGVSVENSELSITLWRFTTDWSDENIMGNLAILD